MIDALLHLLQTICYCNYCSPFIDHFFYLWREGSLKTPETVDFGIPQPTTIGWLEIVLLNGKCMHRNKETALDINKQPTIKPIIHLNNQSKTIEIYWLPGPPVASTRVVRSCTATPETSVDNTWL